MGPGQGRQLLTRTAGGQTTRWTRNDLGQVTQVFLPDPTALYSYTYDAAHRLASVTDHRGPKTLTYNWSPGGLLNFFEDSDGQRTDYSYDPHGRLTQIWAPNGDMVDFLYDAGGRLTEKWFPNGVQAQYAWNGDGTLGSLTNRHGATTITSHVYGNDGFRNRRTHTETIGGATTPYRYGYDNLNRLIEVRHDQTSALLESYAYDALGNRVRKTDAAGTVTAYVHDAANQLLEARQGSPTGALLMALVYDANGNLTRKCEGGGVTVSPTTCSGATVMDLTYDALNRLAQVAKTGLATQTYAYDDSGRRIQKTAGATLTNYVYTGEDIHATFGATWTNTATYTHGPNTDDPIIKMSGGTAQYFHADGLGSVVALTNATGGTDSTARYDAWGNPIAVTGNPAIYGYTGREPDETGLMYYRARYYDPVVGRFTQRDPLGLAGGTNPYAYAGGSPTNLVDPYGMKPHDPVAVAIAMIDPEYASGSRTPGTQRLEGEAAYDEFGNEVVQAGVPFAAPNNPAMAPPMPGTAPQGGITPEVGQQAADSVADFFEGVLSTINKVLKAVKDLLITQSESGENVDTTKPGPSRRQIDTSPWTSEKLHA